MNVLVSVNKKFLYPLEILLFSLYKTQSDKIDIYFLNMSLSDEDVLSIYNLSNNLNMGFHRIDVPNEINDFFNHLISSKSEYFKNFYEMNLSLETYMRLFVIDLLPSSLDRILWLDSDCIVQRDIKDFYEKDFLNYSLIGCDHGDIYYSQETQESIYRKNPELPPDTIRYLNAGVILFNLDKIREKFLLNRQEVYKGILSSIKYQASYFDQDILNVVFFKDILWEDPFKYNCPPNQMFKGGLQNNNIIYDYLDNASIIHYCSMEKPWILGNTLESKKVKYWKKVEKEFKKYKESYYNK